MSLDNGKLGIPLDILLRMSAAKGTQRRSMEINIFWAALKDAIALIEMEIESSKLPGNAYRSSEYVKYMRRLKGTLKQYRRAMRGVLIEGSNRSWGLGPEVKCGRK